VKGPQLEEERTYAVIEMTGKVRINLPWLHCASNADSGSALDAVICIREHCAGGWGLISATSQVSLSLLPSDERHLADLCCLLNQNLNHREQIALLDSLLLLVPRVQGMGSKPS